MWRLLIPNVASAHVKWFAQDQPSTPPVEFHWSDPGVIIWIAVCVVIIAAAILLERVLRKPSSFKDLCERNGKYIRYVFQFLVGVWLITTAYNGQLLAPNYLADESLVSHALLIAEYAVGIAFIVNLLVPAASVVLLLVYIGVMIQHGFVETLDHVDIIGYSVFLFMMTAPQQWGLTYYKQWAIPTLRFFTGAALIVLGLSEKLLNPQLAMSFLQDHHWNFMQMLGMQFFTDELFILSAGFTEMLFGIIFILGVVTRINTAVLAIFFTTTAIVLGPTEIIGHLPFFGIVALFLLYGSGEHLKVVRPILR